ncbi:hypothetical protein AAMO2058_001143000 [Amorphochlora amoebiformis]
MSGSTKSHPPSLFGTKEVPSNKRGVLSIEKRHVVQFCNARIVRNGRLSDADEEYLWTQDGRIIDPAARFWEAAERRKFAADVTVDCHGLILAPGFIDVQINGGFGVDFSTLAFDPTGGRSSLPTLTDDSKENSSRKRKREDEHRIKARESIIELAQGILAHGVTSFCPTVITSSADTYRRLGLLFKRTPGSKRHANVLGMHLEGPFISELKYGCHPIEFVKKPEGGYKTVEKMYGRLLAQTDLITIAPELKGSLQAIHTLTKKGIVVSCGHSMANLEQAEEGMSAGAKMVTHLFNAMQPFHHRDPGLLGLLGGKEKRPYYGIISDGVHAHPNSVRIAYRAHPGGVVLITDAMSAMGLGEGEFKLGGANVTIRRNKATVNNGSVLAGSIATMDSCVRNFKSFTGCSSVEALKAASLNPAKVLGIQQKKGQLDIGCDADMVLLDEDLMVKATFVGGECAYLSPNFDLKCNFRA